MPYSDSQVKLFMAAAHNKRIAEKHGMGTHEARKMAMEASPKQRSKAMKAKPKHRAAVKRTAMDY